MTKRSFIYAFVLLTQIIYGQINKTDAIYKKLQNSKDSNESIRLYRKLALNYFDANQIERSIHYHLKGLELSSSMHDTTSMIDFHMDLMNSYSRLNATAPYLKSCYAGLELSEKINDKRRTSIFYGNLGEGFRVEGDYEKSLNYFLKAKELNLLRKDSAALAGNFNNIGLVYKNTNKIDKAITCFNNSIELSKLIKHDEILTQALNNLALVYFDKAEFKLALNQFNLSLEIAEKINDEYQAGIVMSNIAACYDNLNDAKKCESFLLRSLEIANKINDIEGQLENNYDLAALYTKTNELKKALAHYQNYMSLKIKLDDENKERDIQRQEEKRLFEKEISNIQKEQEIKDTKVKSEKERNKIVTIAISIGLVIVSILLFILFNRFKITQSQKLIIEKQKHLVDEKQKEILDSIHYAKRIQTTLLAHKEFIDDNIKNNFILFKPKDIVSGDFYWATKKEDRFYLAVCDSTGHGVPGAFMSLLNINFLNEAINEKNITEPNKVLDHVRTRLIESISKDGQQDGFDGILLCFDKKTNKITYSAANNAPVLIDTSSDMIQLEADKMPVGKGITYNPFQLYTIENKSNRAIYLYTDGFADQFGGPKGKKFKYKQLNDLLLKNKNLPMAEQKELLDHAFTNWKGELEQVDDVLLIGIIL